MKFLERPSETPSQDEKPASEDRLVMLCDGVFAIAITLLVIDIKLPAGIQHKDFSTALGKMMSEQVISYLLSFFVIAIYWNVHRRIMRTVKRIDGAFIWLTFLFLAFIAFFPVTTSIVGGEYGKYSEAVILYTLVFAGCGFSSQLLWLYACWHHRLIGPELSREEIIYRSINALTTPVFFSLSLLLLLIPSFHDNPSNVFWSWFLVILVPPILHRFRPGRQAKRAAGETRSSEGSTEDITLK